MSSTETQPLLQKQLILESKPDIIRQVEIVVDKLKQDWEFKEDVYGNVMIAVTEAVNNSIHHGNKSDASKRVFIDFEMKNPYMLIVRVTDEGEGFDPDSLEDPTSPGNIENIGGRGVFLMKHLSDSLKFDDNGRQVEMTFNI